jgi:hypothetical protein
MPSPGEAGISGFHLLPIGLSQYVVRKLSRPIASGGNEGERRRNRLVWSAQGDPRDISVEE